MIADEILTYAGFLKNNLQTFFDYFTKGVQVLADTYFDSGNDNSHEIMAIPPEFYSTVYNENRANMFTDRFNSYADGQGMQPFLYACLVKLENGELNFIDYTMISQDYSGWWDDLDDSEIEELMTIEAAHDFNLHSFNDYPTEDIVQYFGNDNNFYFKPKNHSASDAGYTYTGYYGGNYGTHNMTSMSIGFVSGDFTRRGDRIDFSFSIPAITGNGFSGLYKQPFILVTDDMNAVNYYVTNNDADNNYSENVNTGDGDPFTIYYGDNYVIYYIPAGNKLSYDDIQLTTQRVVNVIVSDNPGMSPIHIPTYDENKFGPEPPEPSELVSDNQEDGGNYNHAEFTKVYACTSAELDNLYQWMGGGAAGSSGTSPVTVPDNFDPMNRIVGLIGYPMIIDAGVGDETTFTFRNAANQTINTGWSTYKYANFDRAFDFGTVEIPNWEEVNNGAPFLDYSATVEIYIPFCGVVGLDPQSVMGCTLSCKMWIDFLTGDCSAVVYTNYGGEDAQHPVAFVSGNCGSAEVVSANAFGAYQGAKAQASHKMSQAILGGFKDLATSVIGGATTGFTRGAANPSGTGGNAGMRAGAIGSVIGGAMNLGVNLTLQNLDNRYAVQVAKNALGTTISGSFGQQTSWYYMDTPYIKVTWPTPISKDVELYGKTFGVPVHRSGTLSEFTGYTVCNNVDVSGIAGATASELAIIKQFLETGVFIKEGGGE